MNLSSSRYEVLGRGTHSSRCLETQLFSHVSLSVCRSRSSQGVAAMGTQEDGPQSLLRRGLWLSVPAWEPARTDVKRVLHPGRRPPSLDGRRAKRGKEMLRAGLGPSSSGPRGPPHGEPSCSCCRPQTHQVSRAQLPPCPIPFFQQTNERPDPPLRSHDRLVVSCGGICSCQKN